MSPSSPAPSSKTPLLSDRTYTVLKHVAAVGLPALITLYFALAQVWHWADTAQVMVTLSAFNTFLGGLMGYSTFTYNASDARYDGEIQVDDSGPRTVATLSFNEDPAKMLNKSAATLKVTSSPGLEVPDTPQQ